jgi:hypothetical protein
MAVCRGAKFHGFSSTRNAALAYFLISCCRIMNRCSPFLLAQSRLMKLLVSCCFDVSSLNPPHGWHGLRSSVS